MGAERLRVAQQTVRRKRSGDYEHLYGDSNDNVPQKSFKQKKSLATGREEVAAIRMKFPTKVAVIVERYKGERNLPDIDKVKFLVPQELTMSQFSTILRNRLQISSIETFFLFINKRTLPTLSQSVAELYRDNRDEDGFLYVTYASQEVFG